MTDASLTYLGLIPVEQKGWLTLQVQDHQPITAVCVIGHISQNSIVVLSSWQDVIPLEKIEQAEICYIENSGLYTLTATRLEAQLSTGGLRLHLFPPFQMSHRQQREFIRIEPDTQVQVTFSPLYPVDYASGTGVLKDISGSGLRFITDEFVHKDSILKLTFPLPETGELLQGIAQVVRKEFDQEETITSVRFLDIDPAYQQKIISYCVAEQLRIAQYQIKQKRKFARVSLYAPLSVQLRAVDHETIHMAHIENVGGGGMYIHSIDPLPASPLYQLTFELPHRHIITAYAKTVEQNITADKSTYHLEFVDIEAGAQELIVDYVLEHQLALLHEPPVILSSARS